MSTVFWNFSVECLPPEVPADAVQNGLGYPLSTGTWLLYCLLWLLWTVLCAVQSLNPQSQSLDTSHQQRDASSTASFDDWIALDAAWTAMKGANNAESALEHLNEMACVLLSVASDAGWIKLNFPLGLSMAVVLHFER